MELCSFRAGPHDFPAFPAPVREQLHTPSSPIIIPFPHTQYVSEVEADLYSVDKILNMHSRGDNEEVSALSLNAN